MAKITSKVSVTTSSTLIVDTKFRRKNLYLTNEGTAICYLSNETATTDDLPLYPRQSIALKWSGKVFGITGSGTSDIRVWDET